MMRSLRLLILAGMAVLAIPVSAVAVLDWRAGKIVIVHNKGAQSIQISETITDGAYVERSEPKVVAAGGSAWFYFFPKLKTGVVKLRCGGGGSYAIISLGNRRSGFLLSNVTLNSCSDVISRSNFTG